MATPFHTTPALDGITFPEFHLTMALSTTGLTALTAVGKAVSIHAANANTVKVAADGDYIFGRIVSYEDRINEGTRLVTVATRFVAELPIKSGETVAVGDTVIGAGAGEVKSAAAGATTRAEYNTVLAVRTGFATVARV